MRDRIPLGSIADLHTGKKVGIVEMVRLAKLRLKRQPLGLTSLVSDSLCIVSAHWPQSEIELYGNMLEGTVRAGAPGNTSEQMGSKKAKEPPFTTAEKKWLKKRSRRRMPLLRDVQSEHL